MKKEYIKPATTSLNVTLSTIVCTSNPTSDTEIEVKPGGGQGGMDTNKHRGDWGNVWGK